MSAFERKTGLKAWASRLVPLAWLAGSFALLWPVLSRQDPAEIAAYWTSIEPAQWGLAALATVISLGAVSQYDVIGHRHFGNKISALRGRAAGVAAVALGQTLGAGPVVGGLVRWRLIPELGAAMAARITLFTTLTFVIGMAASIAAIALIGGPVGVTAWAAIATLLIVTATFIAATLWPCWRFRGFRLEMPSLRALGAAILWAYVDIAYAGLALYVLLPAELTVAFWPFLTAFALALAVGVLSGTPAGAGPFDLTLLSMVGLTLPNAPETAGLLVALGAFRLVYYVAPALLAFAYVAFLPRTAPPVLSEAPADTSALEELPRAEAAVIRQNGGHMAYVAGHLMATWPTAQALVGLFDPSEPPRPAFFKDLARQARQQNRFALIYKCSARTALRAKAARWSVLHLADEAMLRPASFDLQGPARAGLRRKLRKADKAGVTVAQAARGDMAALAQLDREWQSRNGSARGGTMGRFCRTYVARQRVYVARVADVPVAFVTFHTSALEWTLDLMRDGANAPDGTMYTLVATALADARAEEIPQVCLSAAPACPDPSSATWRGLSFTMARYTRATGLRQFKSAFAPTWVARYIAAPNPVALAVGLADIARDVLRPPPLTARAPVEFENIHVNDENNEVASQSAA